MLRYNLIYIITFFISSLFFVLITTVYTYDDIQDYLNSRTKEAINSTNTMYSKTDGFASLIHNQIIKNRDVIELFKDAYSADEKRQNEIRDKIYANLKQEFESWGEYNIHLLHFHLPNNDSFLRFHNPLKFGDNLSDIRKTIAYANKYQKPIKSFEQGRLYNGFRYVFPLFYKDRHIGSMEISFSLEDYKKMYESDFGHKVELIIEKEIVEQKGFDIHKMRYTAYPGNERFLIMKESLNNKERTTFYEKLKNDPQLIKKMGNYETFTTYISCRDGIRTVSLIPIINLITTKNTGYMIFFMKSQYLDDMMNNYILKISLSVMFSFFLTYFYYKLREMAIKNRGILDSSDNIILVFHENKIVDCNNAFLLFNHLNSLQEYRYRENFEEAFIAHEDFFYEHKLDYTLWIEDILKLPKHERIISIMSGNGLPRAFMLNISPLKKHINEWVVIFRDITQERIKNNILEKKANIDKLTNIYNRAYFEERIELLYQEEIKKHALIMFDIDFFKNVNDTYGHEVGDLTLKLLAQIVSKSIRKDDLFARWGGEEFMLLVDVHGEKAVEIAEHIRVAISHNSDNLEKTPPFTCSFGVVNLQDFDTFEQAFKEVDKRLYRAKQEGRNRVVSK